VGKYSVGKTSVIESLGGVEFASRHRYTAIYPVDWVWLDSLNAMTLEVADPELKEIESARLVVLVADSVPNREDIRLFNRVRMLSPNSPRIVFVNRWDIVLQLPREERELVRERVFTELRQFVANTEDVIFGSASRYVNETDTIALQPLPELVERIRFYLERSE
jgi:hypothetical protein